MTDLEFGVFDWVDVAKGRSTAETYDDRLAMARRADAGAFSRYHVAEHHAATLGLAASPLLFLAAVAAQTQRIRLVPMTVVVPLYDPLRLVQEIAMVDQLSHGRLELGVGKGSSPVEATYFGFTAEEVKARYDAWMPAIEAGLRTGTFDSPVSGESIELVLRPAGPIETWYPTGNPVSIHEAATRGQHAIFGFSFRSPSVEVIREHRDLYFQTRAEVADGRRPRFGAVRHVFIADTDEQAYEIAEAAFTDYYDNFVWLWHRHGVEQPPKPDLAELAAAFKFLIGSPETVIEQSRHLVESTGVNYLAGSFSWGSLTLEQQLHSLDLFDRRVIPALQRT